MYKELISAIIVINYFITITVYILPLILSTHVYHCYTNHIINTDFNNLNEVAFHNSNKYSNSLALTT